MLVIAAILIIPIARNSVSGQLQSLALAISGFVYFGWMFGHLAFLSNARNAYGYLLYLVFAVELNDVAAYISTLNTIDPVTSCSQWEASRRLPPSTRWPR